MAYSNEREGQINFFNTFRINYTKNQVLINYTDGVYNGNLLEFKLNIGDVNKVLFQAIKYLSRLRIRGISVPSKILLISLNEKKCYVFNSQDYFEEIHTVYIGPASKNNEGFIIDSSSIKEVSYRDENQMGQAEILKLLKQTEYMPIRIDENCIVGWGERYYEENPKANKGDFLGESEGHIKIVGEIRNPTHFKGLILPYTKKTNEKFKYLMDKLNDNLKKKNLGAFYTPVLYCEQALKLLKEAISRVPEGNDYIILDRCAGTGNLEAVLSSEELAHCILSTYEYYEYKVLCERLSDKVRHIIPPIENEQTYDKGFVRNANALSEEYLNNEIIQSYVQNSETTIILLENPPYAETTSLEHQKTKKSKKSSNWKKEYIPQKMAEEIKGQALNDLGNVFIWSAFKYYLREDTDSYIVFSPVKYWKVQHLINKKFLNGFACNRKYFHTNTNACIMAALWSNEDEMDLENISIRAYDIEDDKLKNDGVLNVSRIYKSFSKEYYDKRKFKNDIEEGILVGLNGLEATDNVKKRIKPKKSDNIIGYLVADSASFDNPDAKSSLLIAGRYNGNGFYLRKDNFLEKLPMFAATRYVRYNTKWTERARIMKSGDGVESFLNHIGTPKGKIDLLKVLLFCVLESQNHMRSFIVDDEVYRNEICLDISNGETLASEALKGLKYNSSEQKMIDAWNEVLNAAKRTEEYDASLTYGLYQIKEELNIIEHDESEGNIIYKYPALNGNIKALMKLVKDYYLEEIVPFLFEFEFLK